MATSMLELVDVPKRHRRAALEALIALGGAESVAPEFVEMLSTIFSEAERSDFLSAKGLQVPLSELARASTGRTASALWAWAAESAMAEGELANVAPALALRAVRADPEHDGAWVAFEESAREWFPPDMQREVEEWIRHGATARVERALACFERVAESWNEDEREALETLRERR